MDGVQFGVGIAMAMGAPLLSLPLQEWRCVVVSTCCRGMGADKMEVLCQVGASWRLGKEIRGGDLTG